MIRAVIFDFDGTIIDTETIWYTSYREVLAEHGVELPLKLFSQCVGTHGSVLNQYIEDKLRDEVGIEEIRDHARELFNRDIVNVPLREGVAEFLEEARQAGLRIGLASSSDRAWVDKFLHQFRIRQYFKVIMTSNDVQNVKPDPELYVKALKELDVRPDETMAIEDSIHGVTAAVTAQIPCLVVPNPVTKECNFENYALKFDSLDGKSLKAILEQLSSYPCV